MSEAGGICSLRVCDLGEHVVVERLGTLMLTQSLRGLR